MKTACSQNILTCVEIEYRGLRVPRLGSKPGRRIAISRILVEEWGMRPDIESIKAYAAKNGLVKLCLNSIWGKLAERKDRTCTKKLHSPMKYTDF